jgi:hypothetical protein
VDLSKREYGSGVEFFACATCPIEPYLYFELTHLNWTRDLAGNG